MRTKTPEQAEKILTVAARLFATQRFHEARMEDVAAEAGVGKGTLYRYFQDKDELYLALLERASDGLSQRLDEQIDGIEEPRAKLEAVVAALLAYFDESPYLFDLIQHAEAMQRPGTRFPWQQARNHSRDVILAVFEQGKEAGTFTIDDPDLAVLLLQGGLRSVYRFGSKPRPADLVRRVVDMFLTGAAVSAEQERPNRGARKKIAAPV